MKLRARWIHRGVAALVAVGFTFGLSAPLFAGPEFDTAVKTKSRVNRTAALLEIFNGLDRPDFGEETASPTLPPGQGGTPPGQPVDRGGPPETPPGQGGTPPGQPDDRPPAHAQNDKDRDQDKDKDKDK